MYLSRIGHTDINIAELLHWNPSFASTKTVLNIKEKFIMYHFNAQLGLLS